MEIFEQLQAWHWFVLAVILIVFEIVASVGFFLGMALAALLVAGAIVMLPELAWSWQFLIFGLFSVVFTIAYKVLFSNVNDATDSPLLNDRAAQLVGRTFALEGDIAHNGAQMIGDTRWTVRCDGTLAKGTTVRVVSTEGMDLLVEPA
jgi:membrane protein implicated in regulation of membrane protease activity